MNTKEICNVPIGSELSLSLKYDENNILSELDYFDKKNLNIVHGDKAIIQNKYLNWSIWASGEFIHRLEHEDYRKSILKDIDIEILHDEESVRIITSYITFENIKKMFSKPPKINIVDIDNTIVTEKDHENGTYTLTFKLHDDNKEIMLDIDMKYQSIVANFEDFTIIKLKDRETGNIDYIYYYGDDDLLVRYDNIENAEYIYSIETDNEFEIKYEFKDKDLSISDYLRYHTPWRVTNYTKDKQYILEYDENNIMKSMIEISNPDNNLCEYSCTIDSDGNKESHSKHPNIYSAFNKYIVNYRHMDDFYSIDSYKDGKYLFSIVEKDYEEI